MSSARLSRRRHSLLLATGWTALATAWVCLPVLAQTGPVLRRLGVFSLLGDSVRIVARETQEAVI